MRRVLLSIALVTLGSGCSPKSRATTAASIAWSCPEDRIQLAPLAKPAPAEPPAEIASDPARLAIWKRSAGEPSESLSFSATGCGKTGTVSCFYDTSGGSTNWRCVETSTPPRLTAIKAQVEELKATSGGSSSTPEALDAMAKQLEALNEPAEAARLRTRAAALRTGGSAPAPSDSAATPPPAPSP